VTTIDSLAALARVGFQITMNEGATGRRTAWWPAIVLMALLTASALPPIMTGSKLGRGAGDQINYHEPTIRTFAEQWPTPDLSNYCSATTPLYHLVLAGVGLVVGDSTTTLRLAGLVFSLWLVGLMGWACARRTTPLHAFACALPLAASLYVYDSAAWLLPDNAGWLGVLAVLLIALRPRFDVWTVVGGGAVLLLLVLTRQIHLWAAAPLWAAGWLGSGGGAHAGALWTDFRGRIPRGAVMVIATVPAFLGVAWFFREWGGLVPPRFQNWYTGWNPATVAFQLALFGYLGLFFVADWAPGVQRLWRDNRGVIAATLAIALVAALLPETTFDQGAGRWTGLWRIVAVFPAPLGRSPLVVFPAVLGAVVVVGLLWSVPFRKRWVMLAALAGFAAAQTASPQLWQRYNEPFVLIVLALLACGARGRRAADARSGKDAPLGGRLRPWLGPTLLGVALAGLTAGNILLATEARLKYDPAHPELFGPPGREPGP